MPNFTNSIDVSVGDAILASHVDNLADNTEFNRENANVDHNFDISTATGHHRNAVAAPGHWVVVSGTTWSVGWWQAADGSWWRLLRQANVTSFTRGQANAYLPAGDIADVPVS